MEGPVGIHIGNDKESVKGLGEVILAILKCGQEQETIRVGLAALREASSINHASMNNCSVCMAPPTTDDTKGIVQPVYEDKDTQEEEEDDDDDMEESC